MDWFMYCVVTQEDLPNVNMFLKPPSDLFDLSESSFTDRKTLF